MVEMIFNTFDEQLNLVLNGYKQEISLFYGAAGTGKTTLCYISAIEKAPNGKVIYIDTENGFSLERFKQIAGEDYKKLLDNILMFKINSFKDQQLKIRNLLEIIKKTKVSLIVIDTIGYYYRTLVNSEPDLANKMLNSQLRILKYISKNIPVIITSQVYTDVSNNRTSIIGGFVLKDYYKNLIKLEKNNKRFLIFNKSKLEFEINNGGIKIV